MVLLIVLFNVVGCLRLLLLFVSSCFFVHYFGLLFVVCCCHISFVSVVRVGCCCRLAWYVFVVGCVLFVVCCVVCRCLVVLFEVVFCTSLFVVVCFLGI